LQHHYVVQDGWQHLYIRESQKDEKCWPHLAYSVEGCQFIRAGESGNGNMYSQDGGQIVKHPLL
jgi:hypothetical protein